MVEKMMDLLVELHTWRIRGAFSGLNLILQKLAVEQLLECVCTIPSSERPRMHLLAADNLEDATVSLSQFLTTERKALRNGKRPLSAEVCQEVELLRQSLKTVAVQLRPS